MKGKVLIFGIGGFVGPYLAKEFIDHGYCVSGSDMSNSNTLPLGIEVYCANLLDADSIHSVIKKVSPDIIVNLAAISSVGQSWSIPQTAIAVNVVGVLNILEAIKQLDTMPKLLLIGSSEEYEISEYPIDEKTPLNANNPYGISKVTQERFASILH